jgi:hypothetical protein
MTGSDDDRMDEMLIQGARDYNTPGPVPREEMWAAIAAARQAARASATTPPRERRAPRSAWFAPGVGIAAALLLSAGIVIGRRMTRGQDAGQSASQVASNVPPAAAGPNTAVRDSSAATQAPDSVVRQLRDETRRTDASARALAQASPSTRGGSSSSASPSSDMQHGNTLALQLVVMRHLAGSEAMITSFRSAARRGERDPMMAEWSHELLNTTRTLEASRVADDPVMKRLLDDLDLVISQIVQYTTNGTTNPDELDLIEQSINRRGVIMKLRSTLPPRPMPVGL